VKTISDLISVGKSHCSAAVPAAVGVPLTPARTGEPRRSGATLVETAGADSGKMHRSFAALRMTMCVGWWRKPNRQVNY